jgi:hypothetical protein
LCNGIRFANGLCIRKYASIRKEKIQMRIRTLCIGIALALFLVHAAPASAKQKIPPSRDWAVVKSLALGNKLTIKTKDGKKFDGALKAVSDTNITLEKKSKITEIEASRVSKVYVVVSDSVAKSTGKSAAVGAAGGFGVGAVWGIIIGASEDVSTAKAVGILGGVGAAIGAASGAASGLFSGLWKDKTLIYDVK